MTAESHGSWESPETQNTHRQNTGEPCPARPGGAPTADTGRAENSRHLPTACLPLCPSRSASLGRVTGVRPWLEEERIRG